MEQRSIQGIEPVGRSGAEGFESETDYFDFQLLTNEAKERKRMGEGQEIITDIDFSNIIQICYDVSFWTWIF